jgi:hypothetical protein
LVSVNFVSLFIFPLFIHKNTPLTNAEHVFYNTRKARSNWSNLKMSLDNCLSFPAPDSKKDDLKNGITNIMLDIGLPLGMVEEDGPGHFREEKHGARSSN